VRYLHKDVAPIKAFIAGRAFDLFECDALGQRTPWPASPDALDAYLADSEMLCGASPKHFYFAARAKTPHGFGLREAIERAESAEGEVALCAYNDGGIISVTKETEEFQANAREASWWGLPRRWPRAQKT
jgi:hypothetical protein